MAYARKDFGLELKEKIKQKVEVALIGRWAYKIYYEHMLEIDDDFQEFLTDLNAMESDPQFEFSYEELDKIADRLIASEQYIDLYNKYDGKPKAEVLKTSRKRFRQRSFGETLKEKVSAREGRISIGRWAGSYDEYELNEDVDFQNLVQKISDMSVNSKNRLSYEELNEIADKLIAGEDIKL